MIIKRIFLSALLIVPLGAQSSNVVRSRADIIAELENLNGKIAEKEVIINAIVDNFNVVAREIYDALPTGKSSSEYIKDLSREFEHYAQALLVAPLTSENITQFLAYEFVNNEFDTIHNNKDLFRRIKFALLRWKIEYASLNKLFDQYQQCANELAELS